MRGVFVGQMGRGQTCEMRFHALSRLGLDMRSVDSAGIWTRTSWARRHVEQRWPRSRTIAKFNEDVIRIVRRHQPAILWAEKQEYLSATTLDKIKSLGVLTVHYNPDPYFSLAWKRTACMDECLASFDVLVSTKRYELDQYRRTARGQVVYSPLGFDIVGHARLDRESPHIVESDVAFVGGWEPRREEFVLSALSAGWAVKVWGYGWRLAATARWRPLRALRLGRLSISQKPYLGSARPELFDVIQPGEGGHGEIYEERYAGAVAGAGISLGLLREICSDEHTTRTFEIPAMGGFLLATRSDEHQEFFEEGKEAEYFDSLDEFLDKARFYLSNRGQRDRIVEAGYRRAVSSGYSYDDRLRNVLSEINIPTTPRQ